LPINLNVTINDVAHGKLEKIQKDKGFRNKAEAIEYCIEATHDRLKLREA